MLIKNSLVTVGDNSGIQLGKCINVNLGRVASLGSLITFTSRKLKVYNASIKKKIYYGVIIAVKKKMKRRDGTYIKFYKNVMLALTKDLVLLGTNLYFPICKEIRLDPVLRKSLRKAISLSQATL